MVANDGCNGSDSSGCGQKGFFILQKNSSHVPLGQLDVRLLTQVEEYRLEEDNGLASHLGLIVQPSSLPGYPQKYY